MTVILQREGQTEDGDVLTRGTLRLMAEALRSSGHQVGTRVAEDGKLELIAEASVSLVDPKGRS